MSLLAQRFAEHAVHSLRDVHYARLERYTSGLDDESLWWRPQPDSLAVGNVLLHLDGNVKDWILRGLGDVPFERQRDAEFAATGGKTASELLGELNSSVSRATEIILGLDEERLLRRYTFRGDEIDGLLATNHVIEHFAWHAGQAVWIAKMRQRTR